MKRIVATMFVVCAIATASHAQSTAQTSYPQWLLRANTISKDVSSLSVQDTGGSFVVLLYGKFFRDDVKPFKPFENVKAEVWLLRHDGTAQPPDKSPPAKLGVANAGSAQGDHVVRLRAFVATGSCRRRC